MPRVSIGAMTFAGAVASALVSRERRIEQENLDKSAAPPKLTAEQEARARESVAQSYETRQQRRYRERMAAKRRKY